jgi:hypothetical protein
MSDIIMKLLAKNAEDRYQSIYGLRADLEQCTARVSLAKALQKGTFAVQIEPFELELAQHD